MQSLSSRFAGLRGRNRFEREYATFVILGDPFLEPLWTRERWKAVARALDPLLAVARGPASVSSRQKRGGSFFGHEDLDWSEASHQVWTHGGATEAPEADERLFCSMDLWAPGRRACEQAAGFPDLFFGLRNEAALHPGKPLSFNPTIVLAVARDRLSARPDQPKRAAVEIADATRAVVRAETDRPWGFAFGKGGYTNAIGDLLATGAFKVGVAHAASPSLAILQGDWRPF